MDDEEEEGGVADLDGEVAGDGEDFGEEDGMV